MAHNELPYSFGMLQFGLYHAIYMFTFFVSMRKVTFALKIQTFSFKQILDDKFEVSHPA